VFHRSAVEALRSIGYDEIIVFPTGPRPERGEVEHAAPAHRAALVDMTFRGLSGVRVDVSDLDRGRFTPACDLESRHAAGKELWHVVAAELLAGGRDGRSVIHTTWDDGALLWRRSRFVVLHPSSIPPDPADLPPVHRLLPIEGHVPSAELRVMVYGGKSVAGLLTKEVARYIERHRLFHPYPARAASRYQLENPRVMFAFDPQNDRAKQLADRYAALAGDQPDVILVVGGDGTMLRAIHDHWHMRVPFLGLNAGHLGFWMNARLPDELDGLELVCHPMPMLRVDAEDADGCIAQALAYSDAWLERTTGQAAWLRLDVDGQTRLQKIVGDGMLVATASGSSGYARAMGAGPVPLSSPVLTLAGSNIFQPRFWKQMTLADDVVVSLSNLDQSGKRPVRAFADGHHLGIVQQVSIRKSAVAGVELAFTREFDPSRKLLDSLFPPSDDVV
jgi:NAD kinase